jgi:hypothetical protein
VLTPGSFILGRLMMFMEFAASWATTSPAQRREFGILFGRQRLPDWVIASHARIWFDPSFGGFDGKSTGS